MIRMTGLDISKKITTKTQRTLSQQGGNIYSFLVFFVPLWRNPLLSVSLLWRRFSFSEDNREDPGVFRLCWIVFPLRCHYECGPRMSNKTKVSRRHTWWGEA